MDRYTKRGESQRSVPSYLVGNTPDGLSKPATKRGHPKGSTIKTKSTHGASRRTYGRASCQSHFGLEVAFDQHPYHLETEAA